MTMWIDRAIESAAAAATIVARIFATGSHIPVS
jgi:hypothetical protein